MIRGLLLLVQQTGTFEKKLPHWCKRKHLIQDLLHMANHQGGIVRVRGK